jgi:hypothetical protein
VVAAIAAFAGLPLGNPTPSRSGTPAGAWTVVADPAADLWFHGLAVLGVRGFSVFPLYSPEYARAVWRAKEAAGIYPTPLDARAARLRTAFGRDSTFEILHFVPLYFGRVPPEAMLNSLEAVAKGDRPAGFGATVVGGVLQSRAQRRILADFVKVLREEWRLYLRAQWAAEEPERSRRVAELGQAWNELGPRLAPFLAARRLDGGVLLVSPALGPEGRVFRARAGVPDPNTIAVWLPPGPGGPRASLFGALREACFPLVRETVVRLGLTHNDRILAERLSSRGAVRCGGMLLERHFPALVADYRLAFLTAMGAPERDFDEVFSVADSLLDAVRMGVWSP